MYRPRAGIFKAKQLEELKQEKDLKAATTFIERNIGKYHETAVGQYFLKNYPINLT